MYCVLNTKSRQMVVNTELQAVSDKLNEQKGVVSELQSAFHDMEVG